MTNLCDSIFEPVIDLNMLELITKLYVIKQHTILMLSETTCDFIERKETEVGYLGDAALSRLSAM